MPQIINGDSEQILKNYPKDYISISITSPPYKNEDGYNPDNISSIFKEIYRILKPNSLFFLNFGHLADEKFRPFYVCNLALDAGFNLNDTITWEKNQYSPIQGNKRLNNVTEFIFILYKNKMPDMDRLAVGIPYKDKSNVGRYAEQDLRCGGNIWKFGYETIQNKEEKLHKDRFPVELPLRCLKLANLKSGISGIVLDPFAGSGTTGLAAKQLGLNYLLIEKEEKHYKTAVERLK